jgi:hypothetical protein
MRLAGQTTTAQKFQLCVQIVFQLSGLGVIMDGVNQVILIHTVLEEVVAHATVEHTIQNMV